MEKNLWGEIFGKVPEIINSPKKILDLQANEFNIRSQRYGIYCSIISSFEEQVASWGALGASFGENEQKEKYFVLKMQLSVPSLENYTIVVLSVKYLISTIYPCQVKKVISSGSWEEIKDEAEFTKQLQAILNSEEMSQLLTNLVSQLED